MLTEKLRRIILKAFQQSSNGFINFAVDNSSGFTSDSTTFIGEQTATTILTPDAGNRLVIKGMTIAQSDVFDVLIKRSSDDSTVLPLYGIRTQSTTTSGSLNLKLDIDEYLYIDTDGAGAASETFIGLSYIQLVG